MMSKWIKREGENGDGQVDLRPQNLGARLKGSGGTHHPTITSLTLLEITRDHCVFVFEAKDNLTAMVFTSIPSV
jgi:hypothetical protein